MKFEREDMLPSAEQLIFILRDVMGYASVSDINDTMTLTDGKNRVTIQYGAPLTPVQQERLREELRPIFHSPAVPHYVSDHGLTRMIKHWLA